MDRYSRWEQMARIKFWSPFIETKKAIAKNHDVSMWRYYLNNMKLCYGGLASLFGGLGAAYSGASLLAGGWIDPKSGRIQKIHPIAPLATLILSGAFAYVAGKFTQRAYDDQRDQMVEEYFGITDPNQLQYHGEVESE